MNDINYERLVLILFSELAREGSDCEKRAVFAALTLSDGSVYHGTNEKLLKELSCAKGECKGTNGKCKNSLHAEKAVIIKALRAKKSLTNAVLYTSYMPCLECLKYIYANGIYSVKYVTGFQLVEDEIIYKKFSDAVNLQRIILEEE